jgi:hypothetical protein
MEQQMPKPSLEAHVESAVLCARRNGTVCALIVLDLDRFGQINERFGEPRGITSQSADQKDSGGNAYDDRRRPAGDLEPWR